ncbi:MAG: hypothetical protein EP343_18775 [Deltaproteobacteria bacterium]|nr:MAG: hypothetical protein EP343_18775 [Deltaproteobacteria bacterium]
MKEQSISGRYRTAQILLTLGVLEFLGPVFRDSGPSHLLNPDWVGHARFHMAWTIGFWSLTGLVSLYLIWFRRPREIGNLNLAWMLQGSNVFGFWGAAALEKSYGGALLDPKHHVTILGVNENLLGFIVFTILLVGSGLYLRWGLQSHIEKEAGA